MFLSSKKNFFFGVRFFLGYSFDVKKSYLSIGGIFRTIPPSRSRDIVNRNSSNSGYFNIKSSKSPIGQNKEINCYNYEDSYLKLGLRGGVYEMNLRQKLCQTLPEALVGGIRKQGSNATCKKNLNEKNFFFLGEISF